MCAFAITPKLALTGALAALSLLTGCASQTLFQSNFATMVGHPPASTQQVGTAIVFGTLVDVVVVSTPAPPPSDHWVQIGPGAVSSGLQCNFTGSAGPGTYTFSAFLFIPTGAAAPSINLEGFGQPPLAPDQGIVLHIDLTQDNHVKLDDDLTTEQLSFARNQLFVLQVTLKVGATPTTAHIALGGPGGSGAYDYAILPTHLLAASQFGAVTLWADPGTAAFDAYNIVVTHGQP